MIILFATLNIVILLALAFGFGYYIAKGQIVITKKMTKEESKEMLRLQQEMNDKMDKRIEEFNELQDNILGGYDEA